MQGGSRSTKEVHTMIGVAMQSTRAGWGKWNWVTGEVVWSEEGKRLMGFESDQEAATVEGWLRRIHPDDRPEVEAHVAQAAAEHRDFCTEYRCSAFRWEHYLAIGNRSYFLRRE